MSHQAVAKLYDRYPFPPDPLSDDVPPGYNWRWSWQAAHNFCTGRKASRDDIRILDAGCGTGSSTDYLIHLNPKAEVTAIDISSGALAVAQERCQRSGVLTDRQVTFHQLKVEEVDQLPGQFDLINSVGVLHHLPDPKAGIKALAEKLAPGGLFHIFVYAELGRWQIQLMQEAIALIQGERRGDYDDGVQVGRQLFANLPENNILVKYEQERWAFENKRDEAFADMYVHPQETDYNIYTLFDLIDASGLEFVGFSDRRFWDLERLISKAPELIDRSKNLSDRDLYRLIELLDPQISHYEFFLAKPPFKKEDWADDNKLKSAIATITDCLQGWPSKTVFDYNFELKTFEEGEFQFLQGCDGTKTVGEILTQMNLDIAVARSLQEQQFIWLTP
jgi:SAM-dependent methyltransferase